MDQNVSESPTVGIQRYGKNHELGHPMRQAYQEHFDGHDAGALARTFPYYYAPNPFDGFRDFQGLENRRDFEQFDAQGPGQYHGQYKAEDQNRYRAQEHIEEEGEEAFCMVFRTKDIITLRSILKRTDNSMIRTMIRKMLVKNMTPS